MIATHSDYNQHKKALGGMPLQITHLAETHVHVRTDSNSEFPRPNADFPGSGREVDSYVINRLAAYQSEARPNDPKYFYRDPAAYNVPTRNHREQTYRDVVTNLMGNEEDKQQITRREDKFADLRHNARRVHKDIDACIKTTQGGSALGHAIAGVIAIPTFGISVAASSANHFGQTQILKKAIKTISENTPGQLAPNFHLTARNAREARQRNATAIVNKWGENGRTYLEDTARLSDDSAIRYMDSFRNLHGSPSTVKSALSHSGVTAASVELELARIAEVNIVAPGVRFDNVR